MAQAEFKYGTVRLSGGHVSMETKRLGQPVDDVLALLDDPSRKKQREDELIAYGVFGLLGPAIPTDRDDAGSIARLGPTSRSARTRIRRMVRDGAPAAVLKAAKAATEGRVDPWLAPHLARVRFGQGEGGHADEIPDLLALVAWSLLHAAMSDRFRVTRCEWCRLPWFTSGHGRYCERRAPESRQTCRQAGSLRDFRARQRHKEA
jgi:hypothetical protein